MPTDLAGAAAAVGLLFIAVFQAALALGAPLGRAAWGGTQTELPSRLRIASAVAAVLWLLAAVIVLGRAGVAVGPLPGAPLGWGTWAVTALLAVGALMNFASSSPWERFGWGPLAFLIALLTLAVALQ
jgi:hypothetical protein